jgi:hypothetical protein
MALDPKLLAVIARKTNSAKLEKMNESRAVLVQQAQAEMPTLLPMMEQFVRASASAGHFRAAVFQRTERTTLERPYGFYYSSRYAGGDQHAHSIMTHACLPFFKKYHSVIRFDHLAEYIATHFRNIGFRVQIIPQHFRLDEAAVEDLGWGEGWSVIVSWASDDIAASPKPTVWWKFW